MVERYQVHHRIGATLDAILDSIAPERWCTSGQGMVEELNELFQHHNRLLDELVEAGVKLTYPVESLRYPANFNVKSFVVGTFRRFQRHIDVLFTDEPCEEAPRRYSSFESGGICRCVAG
jgi:hypothetical protein